MKLLLTTAVQSKVRISFTPKEYSKLHSIRIPFYNRNSIYDVHCAHELL